MERVIKRLTLSSGLLTLAGTCLFLLLKQDIFLTAAITAGTVFYHLGIRLAIGCAFDRFLHNQTDVRKKWYQVSSWEKVVYDKLQVKRWKRKLPTYDATLFDPSLHTWIDIARAMCQAELIHEINVIVSFVPLLFSIWCGAFPVFLITAVIAAGYDLLFVILQRYNRPRILRLAARKTHQP